MSVDQIFRSRAAIFVKDGVHAIIAVAITPTHNVVGQNDPRQAQPTKFKSFATPAEAEHWFEEYIIATVSENGWSLVYNGDRNQG